MRASRASTTLVLAVSLALAIGCGGSAGPDRGSVADRRLGLPPPPVTPPPLPVDVHEALTAAPVAPPSIESIELGPVGPIPTPVPLPSTCDVNKVAMQVLVIAADGNEPSLPAIQQALGYHTAPYTTWIATQNPGALTPATLFSGCAGKFQGVILTSGALAYSPDGGTTWRSALSDAEWTALRSYEANFHIREISWYVYPGADQGLNPPSSGEDTSVSPINMTLTAAGKTVFPYVNAANPIPVQNAWAYRATAADPNVTPLLVDSANNAMVSRRVTSDGRETLAMTFDSNPYLIHDLVLAHGLVEWVTRGAYLGEFRAYLQPQIDDLLIDDDMYSAASYPNGVFRISANDYNRTHDWWSGQVAKPGNDAFRLNMAFNGEGGSDPDNPNDPLTKAVTATAYDFYFTSHTFTHENLDNVTYQVANYELSKNIQFANNHGFTDFSPEGFISPDVSGLLNQAALDAAYANGIRFMVSDTSKESGKGDGTTQNFQNPAPNIGVYSQLRPEILLTPRRPTNLFYNVSTPDEWVAEYNSIYSSFWGRNLTYQEVLDKESHNLLIYMLQGEIDPQMYHQPNMRAYDGTHTLLGDLHDMAFAKFRTYSKLPIISLREEDIGSRMADTMGRNWAGVTGTIVNGTKAKFTSPQEAWFNATGVCNATAERYFAGRCISSLYLPAGGSLTIALQ